MLDTSGGTTNRDLDRHGQRPIQMTRHRADHVTGVEMPFDRRAHDAPAPYPRTPAGRRDTADTRTAPAPAACNASSVGVIGMYFGAPVVPLVCA